MQINFSISSLKNEIMPKGKNYILRGKIRLKNFIYFEKR